MVLSLASNLGDETSLKVIEDMQRLEGAKSGVDFWEDDRNGNDQDPNSRPVLTSKIENWFHFRVFFTALELAFAEFLRSVFPHCGRCFSGSMTCNRCRESFTNR